MTGKTGVSVRLANSLVQDSKDTEIPKYGKICIVFNIPGLLDIKDSA